jgi:hypothetical protein
LLDPRQRETIATAAAITANPGMIMIAGVMALGAGLAIVLGHPDLTGSALAVCVTAIGWVMAAKGALLLILPNARLQALYRAIAYDRLFFVYMGATFAFGAWFEWAAFR